MAERGKKCPPPPAPTDELRALMLMTKWWKRGWKRSQMMDQQKQPPPFPGTSGKFLFPWHCFSIGLLSKLKLLWRFDHSILFSALWVKPKRKGYITFWQILHACPLIFVIFSFLKKKCSFTHCFKKNLWMLWNSPACQMRHQKCCSPVRYCQWHFPLYKQELGAIVINTCHLWPPDHHIVRKG